MFLRQRRISLACKLPINEHKAQRCSTARPLALLMSIAQCQTRARSVHQSHSEGRLLTGWSSLWFRSHTVTIIIISAARHGSTWNAVVDVVWLLTLPNRRRRFRRIPNSLAHCRARTHLRKGVSVLLLLRRRFCPLSKQKSSHNASFSVAHNTDWVTDLCDHFRPPDR